MGRHERADESKEDRLLRKAREYVEREEGKKKRRRDDEDDRRSSSKKKSRSNDSDNSVGSDERRSRKHKKKRSHRDDDSDNESDGRRHKKKKRSSRRDGSDSEESRHKKSRKKHKSSSSKNHDKKSEKKSKKKDVKKVKPIKVDKSKLFSLGPVRDQVPERPLQVDQDYFSYHQHLWVYLYREEGVAFGDLTSEQAREAFERFCGRYNAGTLEQGYYDSVLPLEAIEESKTTRHKWSFQTNKTEEKSLHMIEEGVRKQTEYETSQGARKAAPRGCVVIPAEPLQVEQRRGHKSAEERLSDRVAHRRLREHVQAAEEEFTGGRKDGRERQLEKKKETGAKIHAAARDREQATELADSEIYGGDGDFKAALAREKSRKAKRETKKDTRIQELQQKEQDRQQAMLKSLGLTGIKPGQKITIAPRKAP